MWGYACIFNRREAVVRDDDREEVERPERGEERDISFFFVVLTQSDGILFSIDSFSNFHG